MRKIIILERVDLPSDFNFRYVFWAAVLPNRTVFYANSNVISQVKDITPEELQAMQNGEVVERVGIASFKAGTPVAAVQADLIVKYNAFQTEITNFNYWLYYGTSWDGGSWTIKNNS